MDPIFGNKEKPVTKWLDVQMTHLTGRIAFIEVTKDNYKEIFQRHDLNIERFKRHCHGVINILAVYKGKYWSFSQSFLEVTHFNKVMRVLTRVYNGQPVKDILADHDTFNIKLTKFFSFIHALNGNGGQSVEAKDIRFFVMVSRPVDVHKQAMLFHYALEWIDLKTNLKLKNNIHLIGHAMTEQFDLKTNRLKDESDDLITAVISEINTFRIHSLTRLKVMGTGSDFLVFHSSQEYHYYLKSKFNHPERYINPLRVQHSNRFKKTTLRDIVGYWEDKTIETFKKHKCQCKFGDIFLN